VDDVIELTPRDLNSDERKAEASENERFKEEFKNTN
jgi:hypothetical protein